MLMAGKTFSAISRNPCEPRCTVLDCAALFGARYGAGLRLPRPGQLAAAPRGDESEDAAADRGLGQRAHKAGVVVQYACCSKRRSSRPAAATGRSRRSPKESCGGASTSRRTGSACWTKPASQQQGREQPGALRQPRQQLPDRGVEREAARRGADPHERRDGEHREQRAEEAPFPPGAAERDRRRIGRDARRAPRAAGDEVRRRQRRQARRQRGGERGERARPRRPAPSSPPPRAAWRARRPETSAR